MIDIAWAVIGASITLILGLWAGEKVGIERGRHEEWMRNNGVFRRDWK